MPWERARFILSTLSGTALKASTDLAGSIGSIHTDSYQGQPVEIQAGGNARRERVHDCCLSRGGAHAEAPKAAGRPLAVVTADLLRGRAHHLRGWDEDGWCYSCLFSK